MEYKGQIRLEEDRKQLKTASSEYVKLYTQLCELLPSRNKTKIEELLDGVTNISYIGTLNLSTPTNPIIKTNQIIFNFWVSFMGKINFQGNFKVDGDDNQRTFQISSDKCKNIITYVEEVKSVCQELDPEIRRITLANYETHFVANYESIYSAGHLQNLISVIHKLQWYFSSDKEIHTITKEELQKFVECELKRLKKNSFNIFQVLLTIIIDDLRNQKFHYRDFGFQKIKVRVPESLPTRLSLEEFKDFIREIKDQDAKDVCLFIFLTGLRISEILSVQSADVEWDKRLLYVGKSFTTKSKKVRVIPLSDQAFEILAKRNNNGRIFSFPSRQWIGIKIQKEVRRILGKDSKISPHKFRHSFASNMLEHGILNIYEIKEILGHADIATTMIYAKYDISNIGEKINKLKI